MTTLDELHRKWMKGARYRAAYEALEPEFELARTLLRARQRAGLSQAELARRMGTTQSVIAKLEGGRSLPSTRTLQRYAQATRTRLKITLVADSRRA